MGMRIKYKRFGYEQTHLYGLQILSAETQEPLKIFLEQAKSLNLQRISLCAGYFLGP